MDTFFIVLTAILVIPFIAGCIAMWAEIGELLTNEPEIAALMNEPEADDD